MRTVAELREDAKRAGAEGFPPTETLAKMYRAVKKRAQKYPFERVSTAISEVEKTYRSSGTLQPVSPQCGCDPGTPSVECPIHFYSPRRSVMNKVDLMQQAQRIVESKPTWKRFIDGTPLANDIAVWMADFAFEVVARRLAGADEAPDKGAIPKFDVKHLAAHQAMQDEQSVPSAGLKSE